MMKALPEAIRMSAVICLVCLAPAPLRADAPNDDRLSDLVLPLSGNDWRIHDDADGKGADRSMFDADVSASGWIPAAVPGNIQADLEAAHQLKPLWYGAGDPRLFEVARKDWWYRKDFLVPASFNGKRLTLVFDGVDCDCEVWFNGKKIGANIGMFRRFGFDVAELAKPGKVNRLAVRVARMPEKLFPLLLSTDGSGIGTAFPDGILRTMQTLEELKSPTNWGWDWGTNIWTLGIWKDVRLEATGPARIDWTRVQTALNDNFTKASVTATLEIDSLADLPVKANFHVSGNGQESRATVDAALKKGKNFVKAELTLDRPALWWPNGQGDQPLYALRAEIQPAGGELAMDVENTRFGVRDVRWIHTEGAAADYISRYQLVVNGRPVRTIGSNLIPPDLLFGRMGPRALNLIRRAKDAGMNTIRIWGGGVILHDDAYDLADRLGIMLVQELPLANNWPPTNAAFLGNLEVTARNVVKQLRNHPSIIEWDGGNEMPWNSTTKHPALQLLQKIAAEEDGRLFRATCPDLGATHGPWFFDLRRDCRPFDNRVTMRAGEFGSSSPANLEVWHRDIPPKSQWPIEGVKEPIQIHKNIVQAVFVQDFWLRKTFLEGVFGPFDDLPEMVEAGQFYGAEGLRYAVDAMRRKGRRMGGLTTWDFNEPWTNGAGSYLVDYDGRTLMSYDFFKQAVAPISLSLKYDSVFYRSESGVKAELFLTSDAPRRVENVRWSWKACDCRGKMLADGSGTASIEPIEVKSVGAIKLKLSAKTALGPLFVELRLEESSGKLLTERLHVFALDGVAAPLAGLLKNHDANAGNAAKSLEPTRRTALHVKASPTHMEGDREVLELRVQNAGGMTALFCEPHPLVEYRTDLFIDNNHCFIPPGESRTITIKADMKAAGGLSLAETGWRVSCWNADNVVIEPSDDVLLAVGRRDAMCREFFGYFDVRTAAEVKQATLEDVRPDTSKLPYWLDNKKLARFEFPLTDAQAKRPARLRIYAADQSEKTPTKVVAALNGRGIEGSLPTGLGIQRTVPAHLAFPATLEFSIPAADLRPGRNILEVRVEGEGWLSWDAMDLKKDLNP